MKNIAIFALLTIIGLSMMSCGSAKSDCEKHDSQATITVTGLDNYNDHVAFIALTTDSKNTVSFSGWEFISNNEVVIEMECPICKETSFYPLIYNVWIQIFNKYDTKIDYYFGIISTRSITTGNTTLHFSQFTATDEKWNDGGSLTITGLDAFKGNYISANYNNTIYAVNNVFAHLQSGYIIETGVLITDGSVTLPVWQVNGIPYLASNGEDYLLDKVGYTGSGSMTLNVNIWTGSSNNPSTGYNNVAVGTVTATFNKGTAQGVFVGGGNTGLTITGLGDYHGKYICAYIFQGDNQIVAASSVATTSTGNQGYQLTGVLINSNSITLPVWEMSLLTLGPPISTYKVDPYNGSTTVDLQIVIWDGLNASYNTGQADDYNKIGFMQEIILFNNGSATIPFTPTP